ncbi:phage antirepressor KilAC domain-containing protein [Frigoribacterium salinisoli]
MTMIAPVPATTPAVPAPPALFAFGDSVVRVLDVSGEPVFVAVDVARALGLGNHRDAIGRLDEDGVGTTDVIDALGRAQRTRVLNEAGLYELILTSRVPAARDFRRWVVRDVLPSIRRTGRYTVEEPPERTIARAAVMAAELLAEMTPRAAAWDAIVSGEGSLEVGDAAKMLANDGHALGRQRLFERLADLGWTFRGGDRAWRAKQQAVTAGWLVEKAQSHRHPRDGHMVVDSPQVRITPRGLERLQAMLSPARTDAQVAR